MPPTIERPVSRRNLAIRPVVGERLLATPTPVTRPAANNPSGGVALEQIVRGEYDENVERVGFQPTEVDAIYDA